jgi:SAM-dependent methyltransferase
VSKLSRVREFWDETPCDGQANYALRSHMRYEKEPWLLPFLKNIATGHYNILEVGCGQGTDGVTLCQYLPIGSRYVGVDMSTASLESAEAAAQSVAGVLHVRPVFQIENAERLSFANDSFDCVLSVGALHHSDDTDHAVAEIRRVLAPGGQAFVFLYRLMSPKLLAAHSLRIVQSAVDRLLRTDRSFYRLARRVHMPESFGTAVYECFGVPILRSYTRSAMVRLFSDFSTVKLTCHGIGLPPLGINSHLEAHAASVFGYLWLAEVVK